MPIIERDPRSEPTALIELLAPLPVPIVQETPPGMLVPDNRERGVRSGWFEVETSSDEPADFSAFAHRCAIAA